MTGRFRRPRVFIYAFCATNLGDDLMIRHLCSSFQEVSFVIVCQDRHAKGLRSQHNLHILRLTKNTNRLLRLLRLDVADVERAASRFSDVIVNIGGSIFIQQPGWRRTYDRHERRILRKRPYLVVGANFGPFDDDRYKSLYNDLFNRMSDICFRDRKSFEEFRHLPQVRVAPDILYASKPPDTRQPHGAIVISVIDLTRRAGVATHVDSYEAAISRTARQFIDRGHRVILMAFCREEGDEDAMSRILLRDDLSSYRSQLESYVYGGDVDTAKELIGGARFVVATRLHAMVLAWAFDVPVFPIAYSDKIVEVLRDLGYAGAYVRLSDVAPSTASEIIRSFDNSADIAMVVPDMDSVRRSAVAQLDGLRRELGMPLPDVLA